MRITPLPRLNVGLGVFVDANNNGLEGDAHKYSDGIRSVEALETIVAYEVSDSLSSI